jgi:hypothetical protein
VNYIARTQLADAEEIGGDDVGDFGVAAGGLLLDEEKNRLAGRSDLQGAEGNAFGDEFAGGCGPQSRAFEAEAEAVRFFGYAIFGGAQRL